MRHSPAQRARTSGGENDFGAIRGYVADEVEIRLASHWTNEPWRTAHTGADAVAAGGDVLIEQVSTLHTDEGAR